MQHLQKWWPAYAAGAGAILIFVLLYYKSKAAQAEAASNLPAGEGAGGSNVQPGQPLPPPPTKEELMSTPIQQAQSTTDTAGSDIPPRTK